MARWAPDSLNNAELVMRGASTLGKGIGDKMLQDKQETKLQQRVHPILERMLNKYGRALAEGTVTAEQVHGETKAALELERRQAAPVSGAAEGQVPVAQPPRGDSPTLSDVPSQAPKVVDVPAGPSAQYTGRQATIDDAPPASPGQFPTQAPGSGPSLGTPMQQANGVASKVMSGEQQAPQLGRPESVASLAGSPPGPTLSRTGAAPGAAPRPKAEKDLPITVEQLAQFDAASKFLGVAQKPELETIKADAKTRAAKAVSDAKMDLEVFKQANQNNRTVAKLDVALRTAQGRLDMDGQKQAAHMTEALLNAEQKLMALKELIEAKDRHKAGDWKLQLSVAMMNLKAALGRNAAMLAGSNNLLAEPKIGDAFSDAVTEQNAVGESLFSVVNEIGQERGSPAVSGAMNPDATATPAAPPVKAEIPDASAKPKKTEPKKTKPKAAKKKYVFNPNTNQMEEVE